MAMTDFDGDYTGFGIRQFVGDTGVVAITGATQVATATFASPAVPAGTVVQRGKWCLSVNTLSATTVIGTTQIEMTDGTNFETCAAIPTPPKATAGENATFRGEFFTPLLASASAVPGISSTLGVTGLKVTITFTTANVGNIQLRIQGGV